MNKPLSDSDLATPKVTTGPIAGSRKIFSVPEAAPDLRVLAATLGFCVFSTLLFSLMPAWNLSRPNLVSALKSSEREDATGSRPRHASSSG